MAYDGGCGPIDAGNPSIVRKCAPAAVNECDGTIDPWLTSQGVASGLLNGTSGNGFDDDCDGRVDENCACPANGVTKPCYLVPPTQVDRASGKPVGWCGVNSKGSVECLAGEFSVWSGVCRGAQPPHAHDTCGPGDFNCDGLEGNSDVTGCNCPASVRCPTADLVRAPFPDPAAIPLVDGAQWVTEAAARARTKNWRWTLVGGDCDNVLPHPTFALYKRADSRASGARIGARTAVKLDTAVSPQRFVVSAGSPTIGMRATNGDGVVGGQVYPAFGLSGDYIVQGEFELDGKEYVCTQKVAVRAPGVRAELCWDTVGDSSSGGNDIDLHMARLQGVVCDHKGWDDTCGEYDWLGLWQSKDQDCYFAGKCAGGGVNWGYAKSANSVCQGWSSKRGSDCTNPRLDRDLIECTRTQTDPTAKGGITGGEFCGPENINLDNPKDGDRFAIGVNHYGNHNGTRDARPHVNVYCNGERVLSAGYNPATGQTTFPLLNLTGQYTGDFWTAAVVTARVGANGALSRCDVMSVPSRHADPTRDGVPSTTGGGTNLCVDSRENKTPAPHQHSATTRRFVDPGSATAQGTVTGGVPSAANQWCKH